MTSLTHSASMSMEPSTACSASGECGICRTSNSSMIALLSSLLRRAESRRRADETVFAPAYAGQKRPAARGGALSCYFSSVTRT